jgi:nicotinamide mononucleotide transporter
MDEVIGFFIDAYRDTPAFYIALELIAFVTGIASVIYAKQENILVYPVGLIATTITVYLLFKAAYLGDMVINVYYSVMSIYGWYNWARKKNDEVVVHISRTNSKEKIVGGLLFFITMVITYFIYLVFDYEIQTANYIDIFTSGLFFTAMWYMATKKLENWTLWIIADVITVPLYIYRGLGILALQYVIFTVLAIQGYLEWRKSLQQQSK